MTGGAGDVPDTGTPDYAHYLHLTRLAGATTTIAKPFRPRDLFALIGKSLATGSLRRPKQGFVHHDTLTLSFPRKRESRATAPSLALDPAFAGVTNSNVAPSKQSCLASAAAKAPPPAATDHEIASPSPNACPPGARRASPRAGRGFDMIGRRLPPQSSPTTCSR